MEYCNHPKGIRYKGLVAAPSSALYKALEEKDSKKVEKLYKEAIESLKKYNGGIGLDFGE